MSMSTYTELATKVEEWLNRVGFTELTDQVEDLMAMAQRRIFRYDFNCLRLVAPAFSIDAQSVAVPENFLRVDSLHINQSNTSYGVKGAPEQVVLGSTNPSRPTTFTVIGDNLYFGPTPDQTYTGTLVYFQSLDTLSTTNATNWFSLNAPELVLFATLLEAALFMKDDARAQVWEGRFNQIKDDILSAEERMSKPYGDLQVRTV